MVKSDDPSLLDRIRSSARRAKAHASNPFAAGDETRVLPLNTIPPTNTGTKNVHEKNTPAQNAVNRIASGTITRDGVADTTTSTLPPPAPPPTRVDDGDTYSTVEQTTKLNVGIRFYHVLKETLLSSYFNVLLVFVPVGIAVQAAGVNPTIVFAMNAIAIVPLAGLLSHATESVAAEMGDTIGALMNVTFGNAVELIIL